MQKDIITTKSYSSIGSTAPNDLGGGGENKGAAEARGQDRTSDISILPSLVSLSPSSMDLQEIEIRGGGYEEDGPQKGSMTSSGDPSWRNCRLSPILFKILMFLLIPTWIWLMAFVLFGKGDLPGGSIFVLITLGCGGRILGHGFGQIHLPPMLGMLGLGLLIRNVPGFDFGKYLNPGLSAPVRQIALAVILTRAGLGLDPRILMTFKYLILRFAIFPTILEGIGIAILAHFLLGLPITWGFLLGFVMAPVSPAVVVPRLLALREEGYGVDKGISTIIIAAASLDNVLAISIFGVILNFVFPAGSLAYSIIQGPLQVVLGLAFGLIWGGVLGLLFSQGQGTQKDLVLLRFVLTFGGSMVSVMGLSQLGFSGAGALGCLLSSLTASCLWRSRSVFEQTDPLCWIFQILWFVFEPLLFGVIGCQIDVSSLRLDVVLKGVICVLVGSLIRFLTSLAVVTKAGLLTKERLFFAISWIPKATVQAAIGPIALDMAMSRGNSEHIKLGQTILEIAVLSILMTSVVGELGVMITGKRFLTKT